jgi:hypothetical protein
MDGQLSKYVLFMLCVCVLRCVLNIGCEVNVVYDSPDDDLVMAETCVGVEEWRI